MLATSVILSGETLFDVAIREYGHMQGISQLASDNGISLTGDVVPGTQLQIDNSVLFDLPEVQIEKYTEVAPNSYVVEASQNIFDVAIQKYGSLEGLVLLAEDNSKDLTEELSTGEILKTRNTVKNKLVVDYLNGAGLKIATGLTPEQNEDLAPEGIDYWAIGVDFVVS